jgi:pSer/pThr/pTyr-binding forkhead associated (FHA) protein
VRHETRISYRGGTTHEVELSGSVAVLGRDPGCDVVLNDAKCSRRHAVVEHGPKGLVVRDSASANGIYVNGRRVEQAPLRPGDVLRLGDVQLKLLAEVGETVVMAPEDLDLGTAPGAPGRPWTSR